MNKQRSSTYLTRNNGNNNKNNQQSVGIQQSDNNKSQIHYFKFGGNEMMMQLNGVKSMINHCIGPSLILSQTAKITAHW